MQRELIQEEDGKLGIKWIPELQPKVQGENLFSREIFLEKYKSYYLNIKVNPKSAKRMGISLDDGKESCVIEIDFVQRRIQINNAPCGKFAKRIPTIIEQIQNVDDGIKNFRKELGPDIPQNAVNYALADIICINEPFSFKAVLRYSKKLRSTVIDAEIAERRTLISVREGFFPTDLCFLKDGDLEIESGEIYVISTNE